MLTKLVRAIVGISALCILTSCGGGGGDSLSTNTCAAIGLNARIINGTACDETNSPVVRIGLIGNDGSSGLCSGTMITSTNVLTAAHCFLLLDVRSAFVDVNGSHIFADKVYIHPNANVGTDAIFNDVAVIHLSRAVSLRTLPIITSHPIADGDDISIFGYGLDESGNAAALRSGEMEVSEVTADHIFASFNNEGSNTCNGDSGGPAIFSGTDASGQSITGIVGVTSSGRDQECKSGDLSLFDNLQSSTQLDFVKRVAPGVVVQ